MVLIGLIGITVKPSFATQSTSKFKKELTVQRPDSTKAQIYESLDNISEAAAFHLDDSQDRILPALPPLSVSARLSALDTPIPFIHNELVQQYIDTYSSERYKGYLSRMLGLGQYYFKIYDRVFEDIGVPKEIKYLSIVESALNPHAVSRMGATGPWQFMFATAKAYGLTMDKYVDERKDPIASSYAAANYLRQIHEQFDDWLLAIAAYNCGPGNVMKAIRRSGLENPGYWDIIQYLPKETRNYIPAFIAMTYMLEYHEEHGIFPVESNLPAHVEIVNVQQNIPFSMVANVLQVEETLIQKLNPGYKRNIVNGSAATPKRLVLPQVNPEFYESLYVVLHESPDPQMTHHFASMNESDIQPTLSEDAHHRVKRGENLGKIAVDYGVTVQDLKSWNNLRTNLIVPGQKLLIKGGVAEKSEVADIYIVKKGDTLSGIAQKHTGATVSKIKAANGLTSNQIKPGMKLKIATF